MIGIKRYSVRSDMDTPYIDESPNGRVVLHTDHLASHAFDEAVERAAFEAYMIDEGYGFKLQRDNHGTYSRPGTLAVWIGWRECAKSRAKRAGGAE